jgi:excisionase family DNA binding protein
MTGDISVLPSAAQSTADTDNSARGYTPAELARLLRVSPDRIREWIVAGELGAINTARNRCGRPRYIVLPEHLTAFIRRHVVAPPQPATRRRRRQANQIDFYPD